MTAPKTAGEDTSKEGTREDDAATSLRSYVIPGYVLSHLDELVDVGPVDKRQRRTADSQ